MKHDGTSRTIGGSGCPEDSTSVNFGNWFSARQTTRPRLLPDACFAIRLLVRKSTPGRRAWIPAYALLADL